MTTVHADGTVEFKIYRPGAAHVRLAGSFSEWEPAIPMTLGGDGWWLARVRLPAGDHRFRYEVDGRWFTDFAAHGLLPAAPGIDSVVVVPPTT